MSVCGQLEEESASEEPGAPLREAYEQKSVSKVVRVLTVLAYLLSVSLAAILLSVYYVCVWKSPELGPLNSTGEDAAARKAGPPPPAPIAASYHPSEPPFHDNFGRGGVAIVQTSSPTQPADLTTEAADSSSVSSELSSPPTEPFSPDNKTGAAADNSSVT